MPGKTNPCTWILAFALAIAFCDGLAQSPALLRSTASSGGSSRNIAVQENSYLIQQSIGQHSIIGTVQQSGIVLHQGFIQPYRYKSKSTSLFHAAVFPNPFSSQLIIQLSEEPPRQVWITLSDILGRVVYSKVLEGQKTIYLEPSALPSGYYIIEVRSEKKIYTSKLIKE